MSKPSLSECKLCGAAIYWAKHLKSGANAPVNPEPASNGNLLIVYNPARDELTIEQVGPPYPEGRRRYIDHHVTCPIWLEQLEAKRAAKGRRKK